MRQQAILMDRGNLIAIGLVAASALAYTALFYLPGMRAVSRSLDELDSKLTYVLAAQKSARASEQVELELNEVLTYIERYDDQMMAPNDLPTLFRSISQVAKTHGTVTTRFEPHPPVAYQSFEKAPLSLSVQGELAALHGVLRDLEGLPMRIWVDDLKIKGSRESGKPAECEVHLVVFIDHPEKTD
jgi:Tfp pilus assembly protein PilO